MASPLGLSSTYKITSKHVDAVFCYIDPPMYLTVSPSIHQHQPSAIHQHYQRHLNSTHVAAVVGARGSTQLYFLS